MRPDVETLIAYAKGSLAEEEAREVERFLEGNSEARRLIDVYRRTEVLARIALSAQTPEARPQQRAPARMAGRLGWKVSAAFLVVIAGLGFAASLLEGNEESLIAALEQGEGSPIALGRLSHIDALSEALTQLVSGAPGMAGDRSITILTTFRDATRRPCREFEISDTAPTASHAVAVACRDGGAWRIEGSAWLSAAGTNSAAATGSSESADPLAGLLKNLGAGAALAREEETALIARNWQGETGK